MSGRPTRLCPVCLTYARHIPYGTQCVRTQRRVDRIRKPTPTQDRSQS